MKPGITKAALHLISPIHFLQMYRPEFGLLSLVYATCTTSTPEAKQAEQKPIFMFYLFSGRSQDN